VALVPINSDLHANTKFRQMTSLSFAAGTVAVPVYGNEVVAMSHEVPVVFMHDGDGFTLAALLGLRPGQNLLVDPQGRWMGTHIPAIWRRGPFRLARVEGENDRMILCVDDSSDLLSETDGLPLFDETGAPTPLVNSITTLLTQIERDTQIMRNVCATLNRLDMIVPWNLDVTQADGTKQRVSDLYQIDEAKIATMPAESLVEIRDTGALPLIYAHLLSLSKINALGQLARIAHDRAQQQTSVQNGNLNLDRAFGIVEDDPFLF